MKSKYNLRKNLSQYHGVHRYSPLLVRLLTFALVRENLGEFPEYLDGADEEAFLVSPTWASQSETSETQNAFEVSEKHLDLLAESP